MGGKTKHTQRTKNNAKVLKTNLKKSREIQKYNFHSLRAVPAVQNCWAQHPRL